MKAAAGPMHIRRLFLAASGILASALLALVTSCAPGSSGLSMSLSASATSGAPEPFDGPTTYECHWTDEPITIDGKADEKAWASAPVIDHFTLPWKTGADRKPVETTRARVLWDREYFYYFAEMKDQDVYASEKAHNGRIWMDDAFEVFFKPAVDKDGYYEFEVNPLNTRMELFLPRRNTGGWDRYKLATNIQHDTAVVINGTLNNYRDEDTGWCVEGRIRWRDLAYTGGRPAPGETWKFNLARCNTGVNIVGGELTTCAPLSKPDFHHHEDYASLKFIGPAANAKVDTTGRPYGIAERTIWTKSKVVGFPDPPLRFTYEKAFPNLTVKQPLYVLEEPGTNNYFLLQHLGNWSGPSRVSRFANDPDVSSTETLVDLDHLVYGMTLHPDFIHNGYLYLIANGPIKATNRQNRIMRFTVDRQTHKIDPASKVIILEWDSNGHNGGDLAFGPDGYLYHCAGDGTSDSDINLRGQDTNYLTSKMIRIDVDHPDAGRNYSIPKDNPWVDKEGYQPEAWAMGFRNPWRLAFDRKTGDLWVGQNGQDLWEQVYLVQKGANYGWSRFEGNHPFQPLRKGPDIPISPPIMDHPHSEMRSLTGGIVYRGKKYPELDGAFIYGDWSTGHIYAVKSADHKTATWHKELARTPIAITGFHESNDGDIFIMDHNGNSIDRLIPYNLASSVLAFPRKLSETGLFLSTADNKPDPALIPYDVNSPLWSDGAGKERFLAIPGNGKIDVTLGRGWNLPEGTVAVKTFTLPTKPDGAPHRIETRLLTKTLGQWIGYSYVWSEDQKDATLVDAAGIDKTFDVVDSAADGGSRLQIWHYPSRSECMACHSRASGFVLGLTTIQLNRDFSYPGGAVDNQLRVLEHLGIARFDFMNESREQRRREAEAAAKKALDAPWEWKQSPVPSQRLAPLESLMLPSDPAHMGHLPNPMDESAPLANRVRSYLHSNCAICHVPAGGGNSLLDLEWGSSGFAEHAIDAKPQHELFGIPDAKIIAAGHPDSSVLVHRISRRGPGQMPPLGSNRVDEAGIKLLREWITALPPAPATQPSARADAK